MQNLISGNTISMLIQSGSSPLIKQAMSHGIFILLFVILVCPAWSAVYYVSSDGDDNNAGTSPEQAWQSLDKVNAFVPGPGDQILFRRGDEWIGSIAVLASGTAGSPILYGAYGIGDRPVIRGDREIDTWTIHADNIYKATVENTINQLFIDEERIAVSRFPDDGYLTIDSLISTTTFSSPDLSGIDWEGATAILRLVGWSFEAIKIINSSGALITLEEEPDYAYAMEAGDYFFMVNSVATISGPGQWSYDDTDDLVYLYTPNGDSPDNYTVTVSEVDYGFTGNDVSNICIQNLSLSGFAKDGISFTAASNYISIKNNSLIDNYECGINLGESEGVNNIEIANNLIIGSNRDGIRGSGSNYQVIDNTLWNISLLENIGLNAFVDSWNTACGILLYPVSESYIGKNKIESIGYNGIMFYGLNNTVEKNRVDSCCLTLNDGGGIYCHLDCSGSVIQKNIVSNSGVENGIWDQGIYVDGTAIGATLTDNTCFANWGNGILMHECVDITASGNILYNNNYNQVFVGHNRTDLPMDDNLVTNNIMYALNPSPVKTLMIWASDSMQINTEFNYNCYGSPDENNIYYIVNDQWLYTTIEEFQQLSGMGEGAKRPVVEDYSKSILVFNDTDSNRSIDLSDGIYYDIHGNLLEDMVLSAYSSEVILKDTTLFSNQPPEIADQVFIIDGVLAAGEFVGQVVASDPNDGQLLHLAILTGNNADLFTIDPLSGEIFITDSIDVTSTFSFTLEVKVTDNAVLPLSSIAMITIVISAANSDIEFVTKHDVIAKLYPNPTHTKFSMELNPHDFNKYNLQIYNPTGEIIYTTAVKDKVSTIDVQKWARGVYHIAVLNEVGQMSDYKKLVIY